MGLRGVGVLGDSQGLTVEINITLLPMIASIFIFFFIITSVRCHIHGMITQEAFCVKIGLPIASSDLSLFLSISMWL